MQLKKYSIFILALLVCILIGCDRKSGRGRLSSNEFRTEYIRHTKNRDNGKTVIKMTKQQGVYYIPCKINGTRMEFIFDTGASDITISLTEALFLYKQRELSDEDFLGTQEYQIANGDIEEGTVINLKKIEIGNRSLFNVKASIIHNMDAPLLLGQSALSKFGKISIDYNKNEITFE